MIETLDVSILMVHSLVNVTLDSLVMVPHALMSMNVRWDSMTVTSTPNVKINLVLLAADVVINLITLLVSPVMENNALISMNVLKVLTHVMLMHHARIMLEAMTVLVMTDTKVMEELVLILMSVPLVLTPVVITLNALIPKVVSTAHVKMVSLRKTESVLTSTNASPTKTTVMTMPLAPTTMVVSLVNVNLDMLVMVSLVVMLMNVHPIHVVTMPRAITMKAVSIVSVMMVSSKRMVNVSM